MYFFDAIWQLNLYLLHQKSWKVVSIQAEKKSDGEILDWYLQLPSCVKDNTFTTEASGTGAVGELHGEEGNVLCEENDLVYQPHIAGWKLNEQHDIFSVSLFASGHRMLYGYAMAMEESYCIVRNQRDSDRVSFVF